MSHVEHLLNATISKQKEDPNMGSLEFIILILDSHQLRVEIRRKVLDRLG